MLSRRAFLNATLRNSSLIALAPTVPGFLAQAARAAAPERDGQVLVVIQLDGGNDGINTVVPFGDEGYARYRKTLRLSQDQLIKINDQVGLNPGMRAAATLLESGRLAVVPGVGYPNPNRSHFQSMAIWQSARLDPEEHNGPGWLGRGLDTTPRPVDGQASSLYLGSGAPPLALRGRRAVASALERIDDVILDAPIGSTGMSAEENDLAAFVRRSTLDAYTTADRIAELARGRDSSTRYPSTPLAERLQLAARLLKGGYGARVFYTSQSGYDTHALQLPRHFSLLTELSEALRAFLDDLANAGLAERVLVLCFSEFGRRVEENGSAGTDHGTAGPLFLAGPRVKPGLAAPMPSLLDLEEGDLKMTVDFRRVYATILESWLGISSPAPLNGTFEPLPFLRA